MRYLSLLSLLAAAAIAGCSSTATNNANMRGTNTNTGYMTNAETNAKPAMPANVTNVSPPSSLSTAPAANHNTNAYVVNAPNSNVTIKKMPPGKIR